MDSDADRKAAVEIDPDREYRALLRSLRWTEGFGLLFVQCSPAEGVRLVERVQSDLPQKRIDLLTLTEPIEKLYETVAAFPQIDQLDVLFIQGIEYSLYDYEKNQIWDETDNRYGYSEKNVSRLLTHLNLSRERFHHHLNVHLVFLVPLFALKYLSRRAPDFFDWRSGVLEFPSDLDTLDQQTTRIFVDTDYETYQSWTQAERDRRILEIQTLLEEPQQTNDRQAELLREQGRLSAASEDYQAALKAFDRALQYKEGDPTAWNNKGNALYALGRNEEAIACYEAALQYKKDYPEAWYNKGNALYALECNEEAIACYEAALQYKKDLLEAWFNKGIVLYALGRNEEAIVACEQALKIQPNLANAIYGKAVCAVSLGQVEVGLDQLRQAITLNSNCRQWAKHEKAFDPIRQDDRFQQIMQEPEETHDLT